MKARLLLSSFLLALTLAGCGKPGGESGKAGGASGKAGGESGKAGGEGAKAGVESGKRGGEAAKAGVVNEKPGVESLRESFGQRIASIDVIRDFQHNGDDLTFSGPAAPGTSDTKWRVHIDSAGVEAEDNELKPFRGLVKSSWFANGRLIQPTGSVSHLPREVLEQGIAQESWAFWEKNTRRWDW